MPGEKKNEVWGEGGDLRHLKTPPLWLSLFGDFDFCEGLVLVNYPLNSHWQKKEAKCSGFFRLEGGALRELVGISGVGTVSVC